RAVAALVADPCVCGDVVVPILCAPRGAEAFYALVVDEDLDQRFGSAHGAGCAGAVAEPVDRMRHGGDPWFDCLPIGLVPPPASGLGLYHPNGFPPSRTPCAAQMGVW